jgi:hypothetical protein
MYVETTTSKEHGLIMRAFYPAAPRSWPCRVRLHMATTAWARLRWAGMDRG